MFNPLIGILASSGAVAGGSYESIATVSVGSGGASNVEFTSIPSTYKHLQIRFSGATVRSVAYANLFMQVNSDTGSNYASHTLIGDPRPYIALDVQTSATNMNLGGILTGNTYSGLNSYYTGGFVIDVLDYGSNSKNKTVRLLGGSDRNGQGNGGVNGNVGIASGLWINSSNAITGVKFYSDANFAENAHFALYGIKD